jgi:hypothetical protein
VQPQQRDEDVPPDAQIRQTVVVLVKEIHVCFASSVAKPGRGIAAGAGFSI